MTDMDRQFALAIVVMFVVTFGCRSGGLIIGRLAHDNQKLRRVLEILPACAIGAVIAPLFLTATVTEIAAVAVAIVTQIATNRFLPSLLLGSLILMSSTLT